MIVLDASVLIAHFAVTDAHSVDALEILDTEEDLAIHPINVAEVLVCPAQTGSEQTTRDRIGAIGVDQLIPHSAEPIELARIRARTGLKLPDCCVLASALREDATLATFDARLAAAAREAGVPVVGVEAS